MHISFIKTIIYLWGLDWLESLEPSPCLFRWFPLRTPVSHSPGFGYWFLCVELPEKGWRLFRFWSLTNLVALYPLLFASLNRRSCQKETNRNNLFKGFLKLVFSPYLSFFSLSTINHEPGAKVGCEWTEL